jgi:pimeloyl-ACP methyl ester carboxylesterase
MRTERNCRRLAVIVLVLVIAVWSCRKDDDKPDYSHYVSSELLTSYSVSFITSQLSFAGQYLPEGFDLVPLVVSGVDVYKVAYKTTIGGEMIIASGIVCVPQEPGNYPVLSFQNGTNTLNSRAPSNNVFDPAYQLVEVIASTGYVVVMADYPGFGESSEIPHPYLVAEPTVTSLADLFYAVEEMDEWLLPETVIDNEYYLLGYSQGGWATLLLHKALELDYSGDLNLMGSACGAGPYNILSLMQRIISQPEFPQPYYLGYVVNAYVSYEQFTNPVSDLLNEPYASRIGSLYNGLQSAGYINSQLTTSIPGLVNALFLSEFNTGARYSSVRNSMIENSITPWQTYKPLFMAHGAADTHVDPSATEEMYAAMLAAGTSPGLIEKMIIPDADHGDGLIPAMLMGLFFLNDIRDSN